MSKLASARVQKEISMLQADPPPLAWAAPVSDENLFEIEAQIQGPSSTVYEGGVFKLSIHIPARYPMEPPKVRFTTPIYHPNIDADGRICLDILNPPPKGSWKPSQNIASVLISLGLLLSEPNPDDGLVTDVTEEFKHRRATFDAKAREWTERHATQLRCREIAGRHAMDCKKRNGGEDVPSGGSPAKETTDNHIHLAAAEASNARSPATKRPRLSPAAGQ